MNYQKKYFKYKYKYQKLLKEIESDKGGYNNSLLEQIYNPILNMPINNNLINFPQRPNVRNPSVSNIQRPIIRNPSVSNIQRPIIRNPSVIPRRSHSFRPIMSPMIRPVRPVYLIRTPSPPPSPPPVTKILVKQLNGVVSFNYFSFTYKNKKFNIMLCGTNENYCVNESFCSPCNPNQHCYNLQQLVQAYSNKNKCLDLFTYDPLNKVNSLNDLAEIDSGELSLNNKIIIKGTQIIRDNPTFTNVSQLIEKLESESKCKYNGDINKADLETIIDDILNNSHTRINLFTDDEKKKILDYFNFKSELISFDNINSRNIRHHKWNINKIKSSADKEILNPLFFLPKNLLNISSYTYDMTEFKNYIDNIDASKLSINLIRHLINKNDEDGKKDLNDLYDTFNNNITNFNNKPSDINKTVEPFRELIKKQFDKSIFEGEIEYENLIKQTIRIDMIPILYLIFRMFKIFKNKPHRSNDSCNNTNYFKNILCVGSKKSMEIISTFINNNMNVNITYSSNSQDGKERCVIFDQPLEFFN